MFIIHMRKQLEKLKIIDYLTVELEIPKSDFIYKLKQNIDESDLSYFSNFSDIFSSSNNEYKGFVNSEGFKIKRKKRFFDTNKNIAIATGKFQTKENILIISTEINAFNKIMIPFFIFITIFYLGFVVFFSFNLFTQENNTVPFIVFPFLLLHAVLMYGIPFYMMKKSTANMKRELEREFYFLTK